MLIYKTLAAAIIVFCINPGVLIAGAQRDKSSSLVVERLKFGERMGGALNPAFLRKIVDLFGVETFFESGTYMGDTSYDASKIFKYVHTVELDPHLYQKAMQRFAGIPHIKVHLGDSGNLLPSILPNCIGKTAVWLDGHFSNLDTAQGEDGTPIIRELNAIKQSSRKDIVILIDDIRYFVPEHRLEGYPSVATLRDLVLSIDPDYTFCVIGDVALAFPSQAGVSVSPILQACTISRLFDHNAGISDDEVLEAERVIANATGQECEGIKNIYEWVHHYLVYHYVGWHYALWYGLTQMNQGNYHQAHSLFELLNATSDKHWRLSWYRAQAAYHVGNLALAQNLLNQVTQEKPTFQPARELMQQMHKIRAKFIEGQTPE